MVGGFNNVGRAAIGVRNVLAGFGVVLSARALGNWIEAAIQAKNVTEDQRAALNAAGAAMTRLNTEAQALAATIATELAPSIESAAIWWRRFLFPTEGEQVDEELKRRADRIKEITQAIDNFEKGRSAPGRPTDIANLRAEAQRLGDEVREIMSRREQIKDKEDAPKDSLQLFDLESIGRQALPQVRDFWREIQAAQDEAADKRAQQQKERAVREEEQLREQLLREVEFVREGTLTREEAEREAITRRLDILRDAHERGLIDQQRFYEISAGVAVAGQQRLTEIEKAGLTARQRFEALSGRQKAATVIGTLANITAGTAQYNKRIFQLNKMFGIADAIISTYQGAARALKDYPAPWSYVVAAATVAAGLAQVQAIRSASFEGGGGGTTPSLAGSMGTVNGDPVDSGFSAPRDPSRKEPMQVVYIVTGAVGRVERADAERIVRAIREVEKEDF